MIITVVPSCLNKTKKRQLSLYKNSCLQEGDAKCRERDSNPHSHSWPRDFKSLVSTNSTIAAVVSVERCFSDKRMQR